MTICAEPDPSIISIRIDCFEWSADFESLAVRPKYKNTHWNLTNKEAVAVVNLTHVSLDRKESAILGLLSEMMEQVDVALDKAFQALVEGDASKAQEVIDNDKAINDLCQQTEEAVFATIIRFQPVAADLRQLVADAYVAAELERVGDYAVGIAKLAMNGPLSLPDRLVSDLQILSQKTRAMTLNVVEAYLSENDVAARGVAAEDDEIDRIESDLLASCKEQLREGGETAVSHAEAMVIAHTYERVGDRATNIAERTVFLTSGEHVGLNG